MKHIASREVLLALLLLSAVLLSASKPDKPLYVPSGVIIDGPWSSLPAGASPGLTVDDETKALTLKSNPAEFVFLLQPEPQNTGFANSIWDMAPFAGRLYLGYGDLHNNRGPVDIVSYDPTAGRLEREMLRVPEERLGGWHATDDGKLYVAGEDARESWAFGNFFAKDSSGWRKYRTIYRGLHVTAILEFRKRLYAAYSTDATSPVSYPFVLVSDNGGASWAYLPVDNDAVTYSYVVDVAKTGRRVDAALYALLVVRPSDGGRPHYRLYRFDGTSWERITIASPDGECSPFLLVPFGDRMLVQCQVATAGRRVFALRGDQQREVTFLRDKRLFPRLWAVAGEWLYCLVPDPESVLYRTNDLETWERVGDVKLLPGAVPRSLSVSHGRLYVGASNSGWWDDAAGNFDSFPASVGSIQAGARLCWDAEVPPGSAVHLRVRSGMSSSELFTKDWVGPSGQPAPAEPFTQSGTLLSAVHQGHTVLQVRVSKTPNSANQFPKVKTVTLHNGSSSTVLSLDEGSGLYVAVNSTDLTGFEYRSPVFQLPEPITGGSLWFEGSAPPGASIRLQVRSGASESQLAAESFRGPNGPWSFYDANGQQISTAHNGHVYVQYRAVLASSAAGAAPFLRKVVLLTRNDRLGEFSVQLTGPKTWTAGTERVITVHSQSLFDTRLPLDGEVQLSALAVSPGSTPAAVPVMPERLEMKQGTGVARVVLSRAVPTRLCVNLAGKTSCSETIAVEAGDPDGISVVSDLPEPPGKPHWSPVGQVGKPFTLTLAVLDRYRNVVKSYAGTVRCEAWQWRPVTTPQIQLPGPYGFRPSDEGRRQFVNGATISVAGEWNLVCFDESNPRVAGTHTVNIQ